MFGLEKEKREKHRDYVNMGEMAALEAELYELKKEQGLLKKENALMRCISSFVHREAKSVNRKRYIRLAWTCGWLCGAHRFYAGQKIRGMLYLLFFWTGIPFSMTIVDLMIALPKKADEYGNIEM